MQEINVPKFPKIPAGVTVGAVIFLLVVGFVVSVLFTGITVVQPGEVALVKNNLFNTEEPRLNNGTIVHLPFGLTEVYRLDARLQSINMTGDPAKGDRQGDDSVQVKTNDGSNVNVDVTVQYKVMLDVTHIPLVVKEIGRGDSYKKGIVRSYARSIIRDELGQLSVTEIADRQLINESETVSEKKISGELEKYGLTIHMLSITNPRFNQKYEAMIKTRKAADQDIRNEVSAQITAITEQGRRLAEAQRERDVAVRKSGGEMAAKIIEANAEADNIVKRSAGEGYSIQKGGDRMLVELQNESQAVRYEGLAKAEAVRKLAQAYERGGESLIREQLAEKFKGVKLEGRPYDLAGRVDRLSIEQAAAASKGGK